MSYFCVCVTGVSTSRVISAKVCFFFCYWVSVLQKFYVSNPYSPLHYHSLPVSLPLSLSLSLIFSISVFTFSVTLILPSSPCLTHRTYDIAKIYRQTRLFTSSSLVASANHTFDSSYSITLSIQFSHQKPITPNHSLSNQHYSGHFSKRQPCHFNSSGPKRVDRSQDD